MPGRTADVQQARTRKWQPLAFAVVIASAMGLCAQPAKASEGGASIYLLGSGGPGTAIMPPLEGVYFADSLYIYQGSLAADKELVIGGNVVAGIDVTLVANFSTLLWVPSTDVLGGTLSLGVLLPVGGPDIDVDATLTGPRGNTISRHVGDATFTVGDPIATAMLGWKKGNWHIQLGTLINVPAGDYRAGKLANISFNRWAEDVSLATTWHDGTSGWDLSAKAGVTFNGSNEVTHYDSGNEFHLEAAVEKQVSKRWSVGVQGYYLTQISDDSGTGAKLGAFRGEDLGIGGTVAVQTAVGTTPATVRVQVFQDLHTTNRPKASYGMLSLSIPLHMKVPAGAGGE